MRPTLISRPRLTARLAEGPTCPLTLIAAPAGFGKTTLLAEWIAQSRHPVAWLSLEAGDNDPARFWTYVIAALQKLQPTLGKDAIALLPSAQPTAFTSLMTALFNETALLPDPFFLVFDDYHVIESEPIHDALTYLLDHAPAQFHLVILTRTDPPLPLSRWRARGELAEIRADDLRFTPDEAAQFLNQTMRLNLSTDDVATLEARTEGWIAALQLAAIALQNPPPGAGRIDQAVFIRNFSGSHRFVTDYLLDEVFARQSPEVQTFLLNTSVLRRFCAPLCDTVLPFQQSQPILQLLDSANLLVIPLDNERRWYRYHHLFADFLRARLEQSGADVRGLHQRAAHWLEQAELVEDAIWHALAASDFDYAAGLIERVAGDMLRRSFEITQLQQWLQALPENFVMARPRLGAVYARLLFLTHGLFGMPDLEAIEAHIALVEQAPASATDSNDEAVSELLMVRAEIALERGATQTALELSRQALDALSPDNLFLQSVGLQLQGYICVRLGQSTVAGEILERAARAGQQAGNLTVTLYALTDLGEVRLRQGQLRNAEAAHRQALDLGGAAHDPILVGAHLALAQIALERNKLDEALREARRALDLAEKFQSPGQRRQAHLTLARIHAAQNDFDSAHAQLERAEKLAQVEGKGHVLKRIAAHRAWLALQTGDAASVAEWAAASDLSADAPVPVAREFEARLLARTLAAQGQYATAVQLAQRLLEAALDQERNGDALEALVILASIQARQGKMTEAAVTLDRALSLAEPKGHLRAFADADANLLNPLGALLAQGKHVDHIRALLALLKAEAPKPEGLFEALSERELEVLRLVAAGFSNPEIATQLVLSVATVKTHLIRIYGKLSVRNRIEAVGRAREHGLL